MSEQDTPVPATQPMRATTWVLRSKETRESMMETSDPAVVAKLNTDKYEAVKYEDHVNDTPHAPEGMDSYRYKGEYGNVFASGKSTDEALKRIKQSIAGDPTINNLERWDGRDYSPVSPQVDTAFNAGVDNTVDQVAQTEAQPTAQPQPATLAEQRALFKRVLNEFKQGWKRPL